MNHPDPKVWSTTAVCSWANEMKFTTDTVASLLANSVDGAILLSLTATELRDELKIRSIAERRRFLADITVLRAMSTMENDNNEILYIKTRESSKRQ